MKDINIETGTYSNAPNTPHYYLLSDESDKNRYFHLFIDFDFDHITKKSKKKTEKHIFVFKSEYATETIPLTTRKNYSFSENELLLIIARRHLTKILNLANQNDNDAIGLKSKFECHKLIELFQTEQEVQQPRRQKI
ncbi:MAG TPA: hypothetical protein VM577_11000 [Anaerovoracaceae bacterium]|nr:hypothetical protein [Anaerovoracaceae bacterium]